MVVVIVKDLNYIIISYLYSILCVCILLNSEIIYIAYKLFKYDLVYYWFLYCDIDILILNSLIFNSYIK
jgi:hypothetical protein